MPWERESWRSPRTEFEDPYILVNDAIVLVSRRYELLRFWNGGAVGSCFAEDPAGGLAVVQMVVYAAPLFDSRTTVGVAGRYRRARLWSLEEPSPRDLEVEIQRESVELHLPPLGCYAAVELRS